MNAKPDQSQKRREFLKTGLRNIYLGILFIIGSSLGWRNFGKSKKNENELHVSQLTSPCKSCYQLNRCNNAQAVSYQKNGYTTGVVECPDFKGVKNGGRKQ